MKYTVIVTEVSSPRFLVYPRPLIYTLDLEPVDLIEHEKSIKRQIAIIRHEEIEGDFDATVDADVALVDEIAEGLRLEFGFPGELPTDTFNGFVDWRE
jgi:hypothetical protein